MKTLTIKRQSGVALFMSLVMLLILTLLGLSSVQTTSMQERMSRNARDANLAFQAAEAAAKEAELILEDTSSLVPYETPNNEGRYHAPDNGAVDLSAFDWEDAGNNDRGFRVISDNIDGVAEQPKFILEFTRTVVSEEDTLNLDNIGGSTGSGRTQMFRATAHGTGGTETARVMIQITYGKRF